MSDPANRPKRAGQSLHRRLVARAVLLGLAVGAIVAGGAWWILNEAFTEASRRDLRAERGALERVLASRGQRVAELLDRLAEHLERRETQLVAGWLDGTPSGVDAASRLARQIGLSFVEVSDESGIVLSSTLWPERAGLTDELFRETGTHVELSRLDAPRPGLAWVAARNVTVGARSLAVVGGLRLDPDSMRAATTSGVVWLSGDDTFAPPEDASWLATAWNRAGDGPGFAVLTGPANESWFASRVELPPTDPPAQLVVALPAVGRQKILRQARDRLGLLLLGCVALSLLGGFWAARRAAQPLDELVDAVDSVARGEADYTFSRTIEDESQELVSAFSRMHRALGAERERTRAAERVAAWREIARTVAHEVKNPLVPIRLTVENLRRARRQVPEQFDTMFDEGSTTILEEVDRLSRLVREFSEFARLPLPERKSVALGPLVHEIAALFEAQPGIEIDCRHDPRIPALALDADQISRALQNVVGNAVEAVRDGGMDGRPGRILLATRLEESSVCIEVADSGPGFSEEALGRLFEPYYTTKAEGTGLGMPIAFRIATEHGGTIVARNREGGGGSVTLRLPLPDDGLFGDPVREKSDAS